MNKIRQGRKEGPEKSRGTSKYRVCRRLGAPSTLSPPGANWGFHGARQQTASTYAVFRGISAFLELWNECFEILCTNPHILCGICSFVRFSSWMHGHAGPPRAGGTRRGRSRPDSHRQPRPGAFRPRSPAAANVTKREGFELRRPSSAANVTKREVFQPRSHERGVRRRLRRCESWAFAGSAPTWQGPGR